MDIGGTNGTQFKCRELECLMKQDDYGFAPKKLQVLVLERIETATDLINDWVAMNTKLSSIVDVHLQESYIYMVCLGKYLEWLCNDQDVPVDFVSIWYEHETFHYQYIWYRFSMHGVGSK